MSEKKETVADIVAALRHNAKGLMFYMRTNEDGLTHAMGADYIDLADRLERAYNRELGALREALADPTVSPTALLAAFEPAPLRAALKRQGKGGQVR